MPPALLTNEKMLQILLEQQKAWENEKIVTIDLSTIEKALKKENIEASTRTIYRKLQELRKNDLITQTARYFKKYQLIEFDLPSDLILVDKNDKRITKAEIKAMNKNKANFLLKEIGEVKTQLFEITEKGKKVLNNQK
ncbi:MAG: hypothetical protein HeimC3_04910 [Candidatus Heimdallarchaeota archaeon LC_3]|nr:MAG: hypothetical protein HeimC3_04910 [Candidatus Heimdallarchaeota archaeon LC_3]